VIALARQAMLATVRGRFPEALTAASLQIFTRSDDR
jgi:hypothetical protein